MKLLFQDSPSFELYKIDLIHDAGLSVTTFETSHAGNACSNGLGPNCKGVTFDLTGKKLLG